MGNPLGLFSLLASSPAIQVLASFSLSFILFTNQMGKARGGRSTRKLHFARESYNQLKRLMQQNRILLSLLFFFILKFLVDSGRWIFFIWEKGRKFFFHSVCVAVSFQHGHVTLSPRFSSLKKKKTFCFSPLETLFIGRCI